MKSRRLPNRGVPYKMSTFSKELSMSQLGKTADIIHVIVTERLTTQSKQIHVPVRKFWRANFDRTYDHNYDRTYDRNHDCNYERILFIITM